MQARTLKKIIGFCYFSVYVIIIMYIKNINTDMTRILAFLSFVSFGLGLRAAIYYGTFRQDQETKLSKSDIATTVFNYIIYGFKSVVLICLIYLIFHKIFSIVDTKLFFVISVPLFLYIGFFSNEIKLPLTTKEGQD